MKPDTIIENSSAIMSLLSGRYPQLLLPIRSGIKDTQEYRNAVLRGLPVPGAPKFIGSPDDSLSLEETPVGSVEILYLESRDDFVHAYRALAYRCEPAEIPASVGAATIKGLINWEKIHAHKKEYLSAGHSDWHAEFTRFTANKANYLDTLILLSSGNYSSVSAETIGLTPQEWKEKSLLIRKYHELTHFVCRKLYPTDIDPLRDEVLADLIGLTAAFGEYDPSLARTFLGIENGLYLPGGRLSHYVSEDALSQAITRADHLISDYGEQARILPKTDIFDLLLQLFPKRN